MAQFKISRTSNLHAFTSFKMPRIEIQTTQLYFNLKKPQIDKKKDIDVLYNLYCCFDLTELYSYP